MGSQSIGGPGRGPHYGFISHPNCVSAAFSSVLPLPLQMRLPLLALALTLVIVAQPRAAAASLLSSDQEAWLLAVSRGTLSLPFPPMNATQYAQLLQIAADHAQTLVTRNIRYDHVVDILFNSYDDNATAVSYDTVGDAATWTGHFLALHAFKSAASNGSEQAQALAYVNTTLGLFERLTTCTKTKGYVARAMMPGTDPAYVAYYAAYKEGHGFCEAPYETYVWLDYSSRDVYCGTSFGLAAVLKFVKQPTLYARAVALVESILDDLIPKKFFIISPTGKTTNPDPMFLAVWQRLALTVNAAKYAPLFDYASTFTTAAATSMTLHDVYFDEYFANNLLVIDMFTLTALETDAGRLATLKTKWQAIAITTGGPHLQPSFSALYACSLGPTLDPVVQGVLQGGLLDFPLAPKWMRQVDQLTNPIYFPHHGQTQSEHALLVRDRVQACYQWAWTPVNLLGGTNSPYLFASLDVLLPLYAAQACGMLPRA